MGTRVASKLEGFRGLGRRVEPDSHLLAPQLRPWSKVVVHDDDRTVTVSWARGAALGLHRVAVEYGDNAVGIGLRLGTRPSFAAQSSYVALRTMVIEHTVIRLKEPVKGRRIEMMAQQPLALTRN